MTRRISTITGFNCSQVSTARNPKLSSEFFQGKILNTLLLFFLFCIASITFDGMKALLFKSKPRKRSPEELVRRVRDLLISVHRNTETRESKRQEKRSELEKLIMEMKIVLYGEGHCEPVSEACARLTQELFKDDTFRLLVFCLPKLDLGCRQDAVHVFANLQKQQIKPRSTLIASDYLEQNLDLLDTLVKGYEDPDLAFCYGTILRDCTRHQVVAKYILDSEHMKELFDYIQDPNFGIASDAAATFKELLTRHRSTVAEYLSRNYDWFFGEYNSKLMGSCNYITRWHAAKLLGQILMDRANCSVMMRYVSSLDNMKMVMNLLKESSKNIQLEAFNLFKLFAANPNKPPEIVNVLVANRTKLLQFFGGFSFDKEDEQFTADKARVVEAISTLQSLNRSCGALDKREKNLTMACSQRTVLAGLCPSHFMLKGMWSDDGKNRAIASNEKAGREP
ncbi:unnamed protein product [Ilex paraguariensis]|uniref:MO25-like protein At5g47540 n=1 Tax=Ilex paraguariensis TaxID=185542 RepID=A0ABC8UM02_9AQUA